jgi:WD40 repeat protein
VQVLELLTGHIVASFDQPNAGWLYLLAFSPDGSELLIGGQSSRVQLIDARTWRRTREAPGAPPDTISVAFGSDGQTPW